MIGRALVAAVNLTFDTLEAGVLAYERGRDVFRALRVITSAELRGLEHRDARDLRNTIRSGGSLLSGKTWH